MQKQTYIDATPITTTDVVDTIDTTLRFNPYLFENDFKAAIPQAFLALALLSLLIYAVFYSGRKQNNFPLLMHNISWLAQLSIVLTLLLLSHNPLSKGVIFYNSFLLDDFTLFFQILLCIGAFFSVLISLEYIEQESLNSFELIILILLSLLSMLFLVSSQDFISMYLAIELQSLCFYVMAALKRNSEFSTEAGLKYFLLGAFSSGILLFGCSLVYGFTGVSNFSELAQIFTCDRNNFSEFGIYSENIYATNVAGSTWSGCELGMICILVAFLFKITAVPFHMYAPDVYEGAPTSVTAFFSIVPKLSVLAVFIRLFFVGFYDFMLPWQQIIIFSSIASMLLGTLAALSQNKIKRLLAFSSIGHVGFLLIGFCCGTVEGVQALLLYLVIYIAMTISLFAIIMCPLRREDAHTLSIAKPPVTLSGPRYKKESSAFSSKVFDIRERMRSNAYDRSEKNLIEEKTLNQSNSVKGLAIKQTQTGVERVKYTTDFAQLAKSNPILAITLTITMFSIAGIPPLAGFYSKAFLMFAAMSSSQYMLAVIAVSTSVASCFYYIRIVKIMYFETPTHWCTFKQVPKETSIALGITLCFLLFFFLYPAPLFLITHKVALHLCY